MIQLLIIADDFIGALATGIQFAAVGAATHLTIDPKFDFKKANPRIKVLVMDVETRGLPPEKGYRAVVSAVRRAQKAGVPYIYKKTDSGLSGNVGAELAALCDAAGSTRVHFIPANPKNGRVTRGGVQYINEVPLKESPYGADPSYLGDSSSVVDLVKKQAGVPVHYMGGAVPQTPRLPEGILVYDSETEAQMEQIAYGLSRRGELSFCAGCSGFASVLPRLLGLIGPRPKLPPLAQNLLVICGSANPVAKLQMDAAKAAGMSHIQLDCSQKLEPTWAASTEASAVLDGWVELCRQSGALLLDSNEAEGSTCEAEYAAQRELTNEHLRARVSASMGSILCHLIERDPDATPLVVGGGTMFQFLQQAGITELTPVTELAPSTALATVEYKGRTLNLIVKPGMYGHEQLLCEMQQQIRQHAQT